MEAKPEKIYVAIGDDRQDGFSTLAWALKKWSSSSISIVILHATINSFKDSIILTPFGKMPANYVNDVTVEALRKIKEEDNEKLLSEYKAFCGKVQTEILKIEKNDQPIHKLLVELISGLGITKLVMGITFMKYSSRKSEGAISGSFYIHRHKPVTCELFIVCGGKLVFLREENKEEILVDEHGVIIAKFKEKDSFKGFLRKMWPERVTGEKNLPGSPASSTGRDSPDQWDNHVQEIESYFNQLLSSNSNGEGEGEGEEEDGEGDRDSMKNSEAELEVLENMSAAYKIEVLKTKINKAREATQQKRNEAKANVERQAKAEWAISLCTRRAEEMEARVNEEMSSQVELKKELDNAKNQVYEVLREVEDKRTKLNSILELQSELSNRLRMSSMARTLAEAQLEKAVANRADMVHQIEELRRQRDVLHRRIEFCREKDAIGVAKNLAELEFEYKEFAAKEIREATDDFSENLRLKSAGDWTNVYRGRINRTTVAIKLFGHGKELSQEAFLSKVKLLGQIRHPHIVAMIGFCSELKCIVFEYMHKGCLRDVLFSCHRRNRALNWHSRIHIAAQVCSGLGFLHSARPRPITHGNLDPSKILLDRNIVAKIHGIGPVWCHNESDARLDIRAFGHLVLQLLTGRSWAGLIEEVILTDRAALLGVVDEMAGQWPLDLVVELAGIGLRCLSTENGPEMVGMLMGRVSREIDKVRREADELVAAGEGNATIGEDEDIEDPSEVPRVFLCPIFQDVMKNPHVAADGCSYELEAIKEWLSTGHDTSPVTNQKLKHKLLTPNHTLRFWIQDWHNKRSIPLT